MLKQDFTTTNNNTALQLVSDKLGIPEFAKIASVNPTDLTTLHPQAFADPGQRLFPLHNKSAAFHSAVYYLGNSDVPSQTLERIKTACEGYGILSEFDKIAAEFQSLFAQVKSAASQKDMLKFALELEQEDGEVQNFYPINCAMEVEESAHALAKDASEGKLPIDVIRAVAVDIVKAASHFKVETRYMPKSVLAIGRERLPDFENARKLTEYRCKSAGLSDEAAEIYMDIVKSAAEDVDSLADYVDAYHEMDARSNIKYSSEIPNPYAVFYSGCTVEEFEKLAKETVLIGEVMIPVDVFGRLDETQIIGNFTSEKSAKILNLKSASASSITNGLESILDNNDDQKTMLRILLTSAQS